MPTSRTTLLRLVRALPRPAAPAPSVVGVDDWARHKGRTYAGIVCDLERHRPLDLLPDATADTWAAWLATHPSVTVVSRDRGQQFCEGTTRSAPQATQVADRWHLLSNAGEALERLCQHKHTALQRAAEETPATEPAPTSAPPADPADQAPQRSARVARYEEARRLHAAGHTLSVIACRLHLHRDTVHAYLHADTPPGTQRRPRRRPVIDAYRPYLQQRWAEGRHRAVDLFHEIQRRGYRGSYVTCAQVVAAFRPDAPTGRALAPTAARVLSPRQVARLVLARPESLSTEQQAHVTRLRQADTQLDTACALVQDFALMTRQRQGERLDAWIEAARASGITELRSFAAGLLADKAAVHAGLTLPWSQGQTEGFINKVKMLKRQMFGRAKLDLLRQRVLLV